MLTRGRHERLACLLDGALDSVDDMMRKRVAAAVFGLCSHAVYFYLWSEVYPQPYEAPGLRLVLAAMFLVFLFPQRWLRRFEPLWTAYWQLTFTLNLPFFFTYMALRNDTWMWVAGLQAALLMVFLLAEGVLTALLIAIGVGLGVLCALPSGVDVGSGLVFQAWPVLLFSLLAAMVLSRSQQRHSQRKTAALMSYAGYIAHELRTPLASIAARASLSRASIDTPDPEQQQHLHELSCEVQRSFALIDILLTNIDPLRHAPSNAQDLEGVAQGRTLISEILQEAVTRYPFRSPAERARVQVRVEDDCLVRGSSLLLQHVVMNLVRNAFEHCKGGAAVKLGITARRRAHGCEVSVQDNGLATSADAFGPTGLGLLFCRSVARSIGGDLKVQVPTTGGCRVSLCLPSAD